MESAISQFTVLPTNGREREVFVQKCVDEILSGDRNPLDLEILLKNMEETISMIRKNPDVKEYVLAEAARYEAKTFNHGGVNITMSQRTTYDFSVCGDPEWEQIDAELNSLKERLKEREKLLKYINPNADIASGVTGEMLRPPAKTTSSFLTIKLSQ